MINSLNPETEKRINELFDELVPRDGKAESKAGEIVRAVCRIGYRFYNDGDMCNRDYGKETCNPAARFLVEESDDPAICDIVCDMGDERVYISEESYSELLQELTEAAIALIDRKPELRTQPTKDMWDYFDPETDCDDSWDDEDEEEEYWDEEEE